MKVAILGGHYHQSGSEDFKLARQVAFRLAQAGHEIMVAGDTGIALAATFGVHEAGTSYRVRALLDHGRTLTYVGTGTYFHENEVDEGGHHENLHKVTTHPDAFIFFPGARGTRTQVIYALHMMLDKNVRNRPIIICEAEGLNLFVFARNCCECGQPVDVEVDIRLIRDPDKILETLEQMQTAGMV